MSLRWDQPGTAGTYPTGLSYPWLLLFFSLGHGVGVSVKPQSLNVCDIMTSIDTYRAIIWIDFQ